MDDIKLVKLANEIDNYKNLLRNAQFFSELKDFRRIEFKSCNFNIKDENFLSMYKSDNIEVFEKFCMLNAEFFRDEALKAKIKIESKLKEGD